MEAGALAAVLALLTGCVPQLSLQPLYTDETLAFEPKLVGTWLEQGGDGIFRFEPLGDTAYRLTVVNREGSEFKSSTYEAHLVQLGSAEYLDLVPENRTYENLDDQEVLLPLLPGHVICRLRWEGESVEITFLDDEWVEGMIRDGRVELSHMEIGGSVLLTGEPEELQSLLERHGDDEAAFGRVGTYERSTEAVGQYFVGHACSDKWRYDCAIAAYQKALAAEPAFGDAYEGLGDAYLLAGRYAEAIAAYNKALEYGADEEKTEQALAEAEAKLARKPICEKAP